MNLLKGDGYIKDKMILFIIGVLVGAVISTGAFYVYTTTNNSNNGGMQMQGGTPPSMNNSSNGQPPEMPGNTQTNN